MNSSSSQCPFCDIKYTGSVRDNTTRMKRHLRVSHPDKKVNYQVQRTPVKYSERSKDDYLKKQESRQQHCYSIE